MYAGSPAGLDSPYNWEMFETLNRPHPPAYNSLPRTDRTGGRGGRGGDS